AELIRVPGEQAPSSDARLTTEDMLFSGCTHGSARKPTDIGGPSTSPMIPRFAQPYPCSWSEFWDGFSWSLGNCIAVGERAQKLFPDLLPPSSFWRWDAELEGGSVLRSADDSRAAKEPEAQGADIDPLQPAEVPAEEGDQVVGEHGQGVRR